MFVDNVDEINVTCDMCAYLNYVIPINIEWLSPLCVVYSEGKWKFFFKEKTFELI